MSRPPEDTQALIYARELTQLHRLRRAYEKLLPDAVDPSTLAAPDPAVRTATMLFTDLRGFTGMAERFADNPSDLLEVLNEHLAVVVRAVTRCGGVVEKFVGDGVLATFGARADLSDGPQRALAAALGVVGANEGLNRRRGAEWGFRLEVGVGIASGLVVVGRIGPTERSELGILGDPVNIAARLVSQAAAGEVLLSASVYRALGDSVRADLLGPLAVHGRVGEIEVYRVALVRSAASRESDLTGHQHAALTRTSSLCIVDS